MPPRRQTRSSDTSDQEGQQNTPPTGHMDPMVIQLLNTLTQQTVGLAQQQQAFQQQLLEQQQQHQHQQHQQHHQQAAPAVTFKSFQAVKPPEFKGSADPVEAKAWLKEMEKAFALIEVAEDKKTEYASYFLKNEASYWWETSRAMESKGLITWARFTELFLERFTELSRFVPTYVDTEKKKAKRFQQGLRSWIRSKLAILELDTYAAVVQKAMIAETESDSYMKERENKKRKAGIPDKGQQQGSFQGQANKKPGFQPGRNTSFRKPDTGSVGQDNRLPAGSQQGLSRPPLPECKTCGKRHPGICHRLNVTCFKCNQKGHYSRDCKIGIVCHRCKKPGHMIKDCRAPATVNNMIRAIEAPPVVNVQPLARTYNMSMGEAVRDSDVVAGTLLVNSIPGKVLIDSGATKSFISETFARRLNCVMKPLSGVLNIEIANQDRIAVSSYYPRCEIEILGNHFYIDLLPFKLGEFDVILGMDWLTEYDASIDCKNKRVTLITLEKK
ncbi:hypothetical protein POM88_016069 [Heracleum sosnowskyi]|uniref:CCHC-type domain-containing protein n=1 Tax=Heracleum sosnowskyi TaxID=360622 RepID=A0AAD8ILV9_9APIA|nr:hypothetical protein POM88_016069 [Heracleum sosnowskyi]